MPPILVSACLLGLLTRYDGTSKQNHRVLEYLSERGGTPVPVCPEQLAGLPTPRPPACFTRGDGAQVLDGRGALTDPAGNPLNDIFLKGALETLKIARLTGCREALLKERSPSCGVHQVYQQKKPVTGQGVTSALLERNGIKVFSEEDL